eukprot:CAMPEP_0185730496 /NCGR_PEP_ID=MMETSP1171-20130828/10055_1 /TAXON_ID=374046 /ORGANISM="Helicotheca tamensis, Strain CCMP826" /LENGTH=495 /DNA_ID=CAMNT_0028399553 /DNA_START=177 /DNA_END=1661 /DNA_ORIENTATION=-
MSSSPPEAPPPLPNTDDPFILLGLSSPTTSKKDIKRAYKRMALRYHPDVVINSHSTDEDKKKANDNFARINGAYEALSGKGTESGTAAAGRGSSSNSSYRSSTRPPPHRRTSSYGASDRSRSSNAGSASADWRDYMPKTDEDDAEYDTAGDSFGAIFNDLVTGIAAAGVAGSSGGGTGILKDFVEFLENNVDNFAQDYAVDSDTSSLDELLRRGSLDDIAAEMDDTDLLVSQLTTKLKSVEDEILSASTDAAKAERYSLKFELEAKVAELEARKSVIKGYLKKARKRLVALQDRYKELRVQGRGRSSYAGANDIANDSYGQYNAGDPEVEKERPGTYSSYSSSSGSSTRKESAGRAAAGTSDDLGSKEDDEGSSWKTEGFGSYGRRGGRGTSRRGRGSRSAENAGSASRTSTTSGETNKGTGRQGQTGNNKQTYGTKSSTSASSSYLADKQRREQKEWVPPHRRTSSAPSQAAEDKRRLRELKVDDEIEKLKRDM